MGLVVLLLNTALIVAVLGLYWLPSIVACFRRSPDLPVVVIVNALLGWTVVGWVVSLAAWLAPQPATSRRHATAACRRNPSPHQLDEQNRSGALTASCRRRWSVAAAPQALSRMP